ncbi:hypothetical protein BBJ28_00006531 [Nothophytophthora sp. Chile5]|nr:hypothetical protein BBJ28_00006531 [Nothophytophthora sp. Chile5]
MRYRSMLARQKANEVRKNKHREVQRRFIQRKKEQIDRIKQLVERMETEYEVLELASEQKQLQAENDALEEEAAKREAMPFPSQEQINRVLLDQQQLIREHYVPLTTDEWRDLLQKNLNEFEASSCETDYESTGAVILGWSDRRKIDFERGTTRFVMSKRFAHLNALDFRQTTYHKLCQPETHSQLFNPGVTIKMQHLQEIDEDGVVLHRCMFNPLTGGVVHTIEAMMRVQHGRNHLIFLRTLEYNAAFECVPKSHHWMQLYTVLVFTPSVSSSSTSRAISTAQTEREPGCVFRYAGCLHDLPPLEVKYWLMEMLYIILRFESAMVAPVFALRAE